MKLIRQIFICLFFLALSVVLMAGDQKSEGQAKSQVAERRTQAPAQKYVVIGFLQTRDKVVTISQGPTGTVYTIKTKDGRTVADKLQEKDLQAKYPGIYQQIKSGLAANWAHR